MSLVGEKYLSASASRFVPQGGVLRHEGLPLGLVRLDQPLLRALAGKPQPMQVVQATAAVQADAASLQEKLPHQLPVPVGQTAARPGGRFLDRCPQLRLLRLAKGGGNPRSARRPRLRTRPPRRPTPIVRWCEDPVPVPPPSPMPSSLGPATRWRTNAPAPVAWAPESSADANP